MLALTGQARLWGPRRLRFRLFSAAAQLVNHRPAPHPPPHPPLAVDRRDHRCSRMAGSPAEPRLTRQLSVPASGTTPPAAVEPGAHPTCHSGPRHACHSHGKRNGPPAQSADRHARSRLARVWTDEVVADNTLRNGFQDGHRAVGDTCPSLASYTARRVRGAYAALARRFRRGLRCLRHCLSTRHAHRSGEQRSNAERTDEVSDALPGTCHHDDLPWLGVDYSLFVGLVLQLGTAAGPLSTTMFSLVNGLEVVGSAVGRGR